MIRRLLSQGLHGQHEQRPQARTLLQDYYGNFTLDVKNADRLNMSWEILPHRGVVPNPDLGTITTYDCIYEFAQSQGAWVTPMRLIVADHQNREYTSANRIIDEPEERRIMLRFRINPYSLALHTIYKQHYTGLDFRLMFEGKIEAITRLWDHVRVEFLILSVIASELRGPVREPQPRPPRGRQPRPPSPPRRRPRGREPPGEDW